ncbi:hypothetical protein [Vibrio jasicida]|uniref:hypothetical protein n=1 Tax=Vibrio jasicida TaxID=766224 RepID=UPI00148BEF04|nr:hypothetical protein [Vibrio jasicida]NOJ21074.1 hypothetical protein [Vibrio jasicida]
MEFTSLRALFHSGELPVVISDSPVLLDKFRSVGFRVESIDNICRLGAEDVEEAILIPAIPAVHPNMQLRNALRNTAVLFIPLLAFSSKENTFDYLVNRLDFINFSLAQERSRRIVEFIQHLDGAMEVKTADCHFSLELSDDIHVFAPKLTPKIQVGESISIIQFLEVAIIPNGDGTSFSANGSFLCSGVSIAHHLHSHFESSKPADKAWSFLKNIRKHGGFPLKLEVSNSKVTSIKTKQGMNILDEIIPLTDEMHRGYITEVGFGSLEPSSSTDWSINSQLNEPAGGVHIALGAGDTAAHIDFVSPLAKFSGSLTSGESLTGR